MEQGKKHGIFEKRLIYYWAAAFIVSSGVFASFFIIKNFDTIVVYGSNIIGTFFKALTPLFIGIVLAYLFNKPVLFFEKFFKKFKLKREFSITILYILIVGIISLIINFVIPGIQKSLVQLANIDLPEYSSTIGDKYREIIEWMQSVGFKIDYNSIQNELSIQKYISQFTTISTLLLGGIVSFVKGFTQGIFNVFLAMVLSFYLLQKKEKLLGSIKELFCLYGSSRIKGPVMEEMREFNDILNSYISGVLLDAVFVCILMTIGLKIIGHNYSLLMGVIIGLLNLIPYFGSIIGITIACLLGLFQGLPMAVTTLIVLVIIQQIDGNVIQPKIVGDRVGLEPLWVIVAVLVFGSYWGLAGMVLAVPFTAMLKAIIIRLIDRKRKEVKGV